jgi:hypothetical protein
MAEGWLNWPESGLALFNTENVDAQTLTDAIATGTKRSGKTLQNLPSNLVGKKLTDGAVEVWGFREDLNMDRE